MVISEHLCQRQAQHMALPAPLGHVLLNSLDGFRVEDRQLYLEGYQFVVVSLQFQWSVKWPSAERPLFVVLFHNREAALRCFLAHCLCVFEGRPVCFCMVTVLLWQKYKNPPVSQLNKDGEENFLHIVAFCIAIFAVIVYTGFCQWGSVVTGPVFSITIKFQTELRRVTWKKSK